VAGTGREHPAETPRKQGFSGAGGAESGAVGAREHSADADLQVVVDAWPSLPETAKANILAMIRAATSAAGK
jgi:hypothetical protein